jgi:hypothetical protein
MIRADRQPSILVNINGNVPEWRSCFAPTGEAPRLPLPFAFGAALAGQGIALAAFDTSGKPAPDDIAPFDCYFNRREFDAARASADFVVLWGTRGVKSCLGEVATPRLDRKGVLFSYGWRPMGRTALARSGILALTRQAARFARCVVLMTQQQVAAARSDLPTKVPVAQLRVGIDTRYYARPSTEADVPEEHRVTVQKLLQEPYVILPGDELRLNDDALEVIRATGLRLVRISQYGHKSGTNLLREEVARRGLSEHIFVFERISYAFLRFLLQHASAYAGFVDASWQPAGWTVACECLASGLPLVLYDGFTARELAHQGLQQQLMRVVALGDRASFGRELMALAETGRSGEQALNARSFASRALDVEVTAPEFARNLVTALGIAT